YRAPGHFGWSARSLRCGRFAIKPRLLSLSSGGGGLGLRRLTVQARLFGPCRRGCWRTCFTCFPAAHCVLAALTTMIGFRPRTLPHVFPYRPGSKLRPRGVLNRSHTGTAIEGDLPVRPVHIQGLSMKSANLARSTEDSMIVKHQLMRANPIMEMMNI